MFLTITTTYRPATDLGYLLHKNPARLHSLDLAFGKCHVFYPLANEERCTAALLLDIDSIGLVRRGPQLSLAQYVNDRPYAATSFLSVALGQAFGTALGGRCKDRPELVSVALPLELFVAGVPCRGGEAILRRLFEPLGYEVGAVQHPLDPRFPEWGESRYFDVTLRATVTVHDALSHLYVLMPVLDAEKHYYVGEDEIDKLLRHGEGWLATHPDREAIAERYLRHKKHLVREAVRRLTADEAAEGDEKEEQHATEEQVIERKISLNERRMNAVAGVLREHGARAVIDLGCGDGRLLRDLLKERALTRLAGMDVSSRALEVAHERCERLPEMQRKRITLFQGSLTYRDARLAGYDAATAVEVIEHLDRPRLASFERVVFGEAKPPLAVITTPNVEYNVRFESLPAGRLRHRDHRFEWSREEFRTWAAGVASTYGYEFEWRAVGDEDAEVGPPTQMGVFRVLSGEPA